VVVHLLLPIEYFNKTIGFDSQGRIINNNKMINTIESTLDSDQRVISFLDCGGLEKYNNIILQSFLFYSPQHIILVLNGNISEKEVNDQLKLLFILKKNFSIVVTHLDVLNEENINLIKKNVF